MLECLEESCVKLETAGRMPRRLNWLWMISLGESQMNSKRFSLEKSNRQRTTRLGRILVTVNNLAWEIKEVTANDLTWKNSGRAMNDLAWENSNHRHADGFNKVESNKRRLQKMKRRDKARDTKEGRQRARDANKSGTARAFLVLFDFSCLPL